MKKLCAVVFLIFVTGAVLSPAAAQDGDGHKMKGMGTMMKQDGKCPMCGMMMGSMMQKSMVSIDGGVVVLAGNRLMKYDKDLKLVKEAEIKMDMQKMHADMMKMKEGCPMTGKGGQTP